MNDAEGVLQAIPAGIGRGVLPSAVGHRVARLVRLDGPQAELECELWLLTHPDLRELGRIRAVAAWVEAVVAGRL